MIDSTQTDISTGSTLYNCMELEMDIDTKLTTRKFCFEGEKSGNFLWDSGPQWNLITWIIYYENSKMQQPSNCADHFYIVVTKCVLLCHNNNNDQIYNNGVFKILWQYLLLDINIGYKKIIVSYTGADEDESTNFLTFE